MGQGGSTGSVRGEGSERREGDEMGEGKQRGQMMGKIVKGISMIAPLKIADRGTCPLRKSCAVAS
jgi:hypothetical protein